MKERRKMTENKIQPIDLQIVTAMLRLSEIENDKLALERLAALITLSGKCRAYEKEFMNNPLILQICEKKVEFILQAKSKSDLKEIMSPPKIHYNFNEVVPVGKFHIEEEELLIWSLTSLWCGGPLNAPGFNRYMKLFKKFYPDMAEEVGIH
jgi:hypothetical protein